MPAPVTVSKEQLDKQFTYIDAVAGLIRDKRPRAYTHTFGLSLIHIYRTGHQAEIAGSVQQRSGRQGDKNHYSERNTEPCRIGNFI